MGEQKQLSHFRCAGCGEFLPEGTAALRFHGSACRSRFWRRLRDIGLHAAMIQQYIAEWSDENVIEARFEEIVTVMGDVRKALDELEECLYAHQYKLMQAAEAAGRKLS